MLSKPFFAPVLGYAAAAGEANHVVVERTPNRVFRVVDTGATITAGPGCTSVTPNEVSCVGADDVVLVRAGDRDDVFSYAGPGFAVAHGEGGSDTLDVGGAGELYGGPGADTLMGGDNPTFQLLKGEEGDDELIGGESRENRLVGGPGADTLRAGPRGDDLLGSTGNDLLLGGDRSDLVFGQGGNDRVSAGGGRDMVLGHGGRDVLRGGPGRDQMAGGGGADVLRGGPARDFLSGGSPSARSLPSDRADLIIGGEGMDVCFGDRGNDTFVLRDGERDFAGGGSGTDRAHVDGGLDLLRAIERLF
jgi:Ca2+-binding RTX toxin-like protein